MTILLDYCSDDGDQLYIGNPENKPPAGLNQEDFFNAIIHVEDNYEGNITHHWANVIGTYQYTDENNNEIVEFIFWFPQVQIMQTGYVVWHTMLLLRT